jgi:hypothetical protein
MNSPVLPTRLRFLAFLALSCLAGACAQAPPRQSAAPITEEFMIPAADPGLQLYVRNKRPRDLDAFTPRNIVLFVHGASYPAQSHSTWPSTACHGWTT